MARRKLPRRETLNFRIALFVGLLVMAMMVSPALQSLRQNIKNERAAAAAAAVGEGEGISANAFSSSRSLLNTTGTDVASITEESECPINAHGTQAVAYSVFFVIIILYSFLGLAIICDDYFVASLDSISSALHLSEDVAGATFMAAGSSAPELFTSVADAMFTQKDIGSGTIAGSAVFNLVVIPGLSAAMGGKALDLDWRPMARDSGFYLASIVLWTIFISTGNEITWLEAVILLLTYAAYITYMKFNHTILKRFCPRPYDDEETASATKNTEEGGQLASDDSLARRISVSNMIHRLSQEGELEQERRASQHEMQAVGENGAEDEPKEVKEEGEEEEEENKWACPVGIKAQILWAASLPYMALFTVTVPDVTNPKWEKWYPVAFFMSVVWIGVLTWVMVTLADYVGCMAKIDPALMGIVLLAAGTSVPDTIASVIVAKEGKGDMAVSNAIGSNVFDILLGLGFPWLMSTLWYQKPVAVNLKQEGQKISTVAFAVSQLVVILIITLGLIAWNRFRLTPKIGYILFGIYFIYVVINVIKQVYDKA